MQAPMLTIAIPTFNRAKHLALLLEVLARELEGLWDEVELLVFDNASTDSTPEVTTKFQASLPGCRVVRHAQNIGSAPNFLACFEAARGRWFWLFGDDDAPARGLIAEVVDLLRLEEPQMVYMNSHWAPDIAPLVRESDMPLQRSATIMNQLSFARRTHVWLTFISSVIVERARLPRSIEVRSMIDAVGMHFAQLSWTLTSLRLGDRFAVIEGPMILATHGNSGGYAPLTVFGSHFPKAVRAVLGNSRESAAIVRRTVIRHLPPLIWALRNGTAGEFHSEDPWPDLRRDLGGHAMFWVLVLPLGKLPMRLASPVYLLWRVLNRALGLVDRLSMRRLKSRIAA